MKKLSIDCINLMAGALIFLSACSQPVIETSATATTTIDQPTEQLAEATLSPTAAPDAFPTPQVCEAGVIEQTFEHGRMFWVGATADERCRTEHQFTPGSGEIWVAIFDEDGTGGEWLTFPDSWVEGIDPEIDVSLTPPADKQQPERGFGMVWREMLTEDQRRAIGWALFPELSHATEYRYEAGGTVNEEGIYVPRPGKHFVLSLGGELFVFDEQRGDFGYTPAE
jgi:hypothetical protein